MNLAAAMDEWVAIYRATIPTHIVGMTHSAVRAHLAVRTEGRHLLAAHRRRRHR